MIVQNQVNIDNDIIDVYGLIQFMNETLSNIDCSSPVNSINSAVGEYRDILISIVPSILDQISTTYLEFSYKAQLARLVEIMNYIVKILPNLYIESTCMDSMILANIILWLYENTIELLDTLNILNGLITLKPDCKCVTNAVFNLFMGKLINFITIYQNSTKSLLELVNIIMAINYNISSKSYVPTYMPNNNYIPQPRVSSATMNCYLNNMRRC